jgi:hypothetical protein
MEFKRNDKVVSPMGIEMTVQKDTTTDSSVVEVLVLWSDMTGRPTWVRSLAIKEVLQLVEEAK